MACHCGSHYRRESEGTSDNCLITLILTNTPFLKSFLAGILKRLPVLMTTIFCLIDSMRTNSGRGG